jgi:outer membrane protein assembly factor BamB
MRSLLAGSLLAIASCADLHDWPMRGRDATRNAVSPEKDPPTDWCVEPGKERNVLWSVRTGRECFTGPIIVDGRIWIGTDNESPRDPSRKEDAAVLMCLRERDGGLLWQYLSPRSNYNNPGSFWGPLRGCPLIAGDRLWLLNNRWEVVCFDIGPLKRGTGEPRQVWTTNLVTTFGSHPNIPGMAFGAVSSIASDGKGRLYLSTGEQPQAGKPSEAPALVCLDAASGAALGREASGIGSRGQESNWSTPVLATLIDPQGHSQTLVLYGGSDGFLHAFNSSPDDSTKTLKELWKIDCRRNEKDPSGILATPVVHEGRVYAATGESDNTGEGRLCCVDVATGRLIWDNREMGLTVNPVVVHDGRVFAGDYSGFVRSFDVETGRQLGVHDMESTSVAPPMLADGRLFVGNADGEIFILDACSPPGKMNVQRKITHAGGLMSAPVYLHGTLYYAADHRLFAIRGQAPAAAPTEQAPGPRGRAPDAQFVPTPRDVLDEMLTMADLRETDLLYDLGSGDGRIVIRAAESRRCHAVGVEIDRGLVEQSRNMIQAAKLGERARIEHEDLLKVDFSAATVVTLYVGSRLNGLLVPKLKTLKAGSRVVSHDFEVPGMPCERMLTVVSSEDHRSHRIFLYRVEGSK